MLKEEDVFRNPCKYCLTKPICKNKCKELGDYHNTMITCLHMILAVTFLTLFVITTSFIWQISDMKVKLIILMCLYVVVYGMALKLIYIDEEINIDDGMNFIQQGVVLLISPFIFASMFSTHHIEKTEYTDAFIYRYNKKLNPFNPDEPESEA